MLMMSFSSVPVTRDCSYRIGSCPKMLVGLQRDPRAGAATTSDPHQNASTGIWFRTPPNVRNTVVAPWVLTLTPVGFTRICAPAADAMMKSAAAHRVLNMGLRDVISVSVEAQRYAGVERPRRSISPSERGSAGEGPVDARRPRE